MKSLEKVIKDQISKIEKNELKVIDYHNTMEIKCTCEKCGYSMVDNYRNLAYKNFKCKYCVLISKSDLIKKGDVKIEEIKGSDIYLICKNGHKYKQDRRNLLSNKYCQKCYLNSKVISKEDVIKKFKDMHGDYYKYDDFEDFKNVHSFVDITCPKGHKFSQKISNHYQGKGCPICRESLGERIISNYLKSKNIEFIRQKKFKDCVYLTYLPFDFYLPELNILIEYDGIQHFQPMKMFGGEEEFNKVQIKDKIKSKFCVDYGIKLIRISYKDNIINKINNELIVDL